MPGTSVAALLGTQAVPPCSDRFPRPAAVVEGLNTVPLVPAALVVEVGHKETVPEPLAFLVKVIAAVVGKTEVHITALVAVAVQVE